MRHVARALIGLASLLAALAPGAAAGDPRAAPGVALDVLVFGLPHVLDVLHAYRGLFVVSAGAQAPGGRLLSFPAASVGSEKLAARGGEAVLWSRTRLHPLLAFPLTGRVHAGAPETGQLLQLSSEWEPEPLVIGLRGLHDLAVRPDGRFLLADADRVHVPFQHSGLITKRHRYEDVVAASPAAR